MLTRREFIRTAALFALAPHAFAEREIWVKRRPFATQSHSRSRTSKPHTRNELAEIVRSASRKGLPISVSDTGTRWAASNSPRTAFASINRAIGSRASLQSQRRLHDERITGSNWRVIDANAVRGELLAAHRVPVSRDGNRQALSRTRTNNLGKFVSGVRP